MSGDLHQHPGDHDVTDRDAIDLSPFQLNEELLNAALREVPRETLGSRKATSKVMARDRPSKRSHCAAGRHQVPDALKKVTHGRECGRLTSARDFQ